MEFKSISQPLIKPIDGKLTIKLTVPLQDSKGIDTFYNVVESSMGKFLSMYVDTLLIFQYKSPGVYDPNQVVKIDNMNMKPVIDWLSNYYDEVLNNPNTFSYERKNGSAYYVPNPKHRRGLELTNGNKMTLEPVVIADEKNETIVYPGVRLYLNIDDNYVDITVQEYEMILYIINRVDLYRDGLNLINTRLLIDERITRSNFRNKARISQPEIEQFAQPKEMVEDNRPKPKKINSLFDIL